MFKPLTWKVMCSFNWINVQLENVFLTCGFSCWHCAFIKVSLSSCSFFTGCPHISVWLLRVSTVTSAVRRTSTAPIPSPMQLMALSDGGRVPPCPAAQSTTSWTLPWTWDRYASFLNCMNVLCLLVCLVCLSWCMCSCAFPLCELNLSKPVF